MCHTTVNWYVRSIFQGQLYTKVKILVFAWCNAFHNSSRPVSHHSSRPCLNAFVLPPVITVGLKCSFISAFKIPTCLWNCKYRLSDFKLRPRIQPPHSIQFSSFLLFRNLSGTFHIVYIVSHSPLQLVAIGLYGMEVYMASSDNTLAVVAASCVALMNYMMVVVIVPVMCLHYLHTTSWQHVTVFQLHCTILARLGSARLSLARLGSARLGSARLNTARLS